MRYQLVLFAITRTVINAGYRMIYPFIGALARGVGVDVGAISRAIALRSSLGMATPLFGTLGDSLGRKQAMLLGLGLFSGGLVLVVLWPTYPALVVALAVSAIGKYLFDPSMQAYLGDEVEYAKRGTAIAITELGWSGAFMLGMPFVGWLIARAGWLSPFPVMAGLGLLMAVLFWRILPAAAGHRKVTGSPFRGLLLVLKHRPAVAGLAVGLLICAANEAVNVVYGDWMEGAFALQAVALGVASAVIGVAELGGEGLVAVLVDRLGKRRAVGMGIILNVLTCIALPSLGSSVEGALLGLFLFYITFEFTLVSSIPLMTEMLPQARATLMAANIAALSAGRALGALIGPGLFPMGLLANGVAAALLDVIALAALTAFVKVD